MSNFKTVEEMKNAIKEYAGYFTIEIPAEFAVHRDYCIDGLTEQSFCEGFRAYQAIVRLMQCDMYEQPEKFGLITYDKKGIAKPAYPFAYGNYCTGKTMAAFSQYIWLFLALGQAAEVQGGRLLVNGKVFADFCDGVKSIGKNDSKPKNIDQLIERLIDYGFVVSEYVKNRDFILESETPNLLSVIKATTLSPYARLSMTSDYPTFNWRMYQYGINDKLPFEATYIYQQMPDNIQKLSSRLISEMAQAGWKSFIFFPRDMESGRLTFSTKPPLTVEYYYGLSDGWFLIRAKTALVPKEFLDSLSEKFSKAWIASAKCTGCRKGECPDRFKGEYLGNSGVFCKGQKKIGISTNTHEDVPYIIASAKYAAGKTI